MPIDDEQDYKIWKKEVEFEWVYKTLNYCSYSLTSIFDNLTAHLSALKAAPEVEPHCSAVIWFSQILWAWKSGLQRVKREWVLKGAAEAELYLTERWHEVKPEIVMKRKHRKVFWSQASVDNELLALMSQCLSVCVCSHLIQPCRSVFFPLFLVSVNHSWYFWMQSPVNLILFICMQLISSCHSVYQSEQSESHITFRTQTNPALVPFALKGTLFMPSSFFLNVRIQLLHSSHTPSLFFSSTATQEAYLSSWWMAWTSFPTLILYGESQLSSITFTISSIPYMFVISQLLCRLW